MSGSATCMRGVCSGSALYRTATARLPGGHRALAPLYLHCITLAPGEAMFLRAGTLHAYVNGTAVEVMASSDNVLRAA